MTAALLMMPTAAHAGVKRAETILPPGQSGHVPKSGTNPHLTDQLALYESFVYKPAGFDLPGTSETPFAGVTIRRDAFGVPNVRAGSDRDLWKGVGYAVAQDRLVQLELFRRATQGRLAEVLGDSRLESDILARRDYYTPRELRRMINRLPAELRARFDAYAEGVNAWIAKIAADPSLQPLEFAALQLTPAPWRPVDSASIGVQLARTIPSSDGTELENWEALRKLGAKRFARLLPLRRKDQVATIPAADGRFPSTPGRTRKDERIGYKRSRKFLRGLRAPKAAATASTALFRGGSNAWAVRGSGSRSWLFHGPQLGFEIPEQLAELEVHRPGLDARGVTPPGLPLVGIGRNDHIAWAMTSSLSDDDDLYAERLKGRERYRFKGRVRKMKCRTETFKVAGKSDVKRRLCRTLHGPVQARSGKKTAWARKYSTWRHEMDTLVGLAQLNEADTVQQARRALAKVSWTENTTVADDQGNIGFFAGGRLPNKPKRWDERLPFPGTGKAEWRGLLKVKQRPHVINPSQGWLANWNNMPSVGWTVGDASATERVNGRLHRDALLAREVAQGRGRAELRRGEGRRPRRRHDGAAARAARRAAADRRQRCHRRREDRPRHDRRLGRQLRPHRRGRHRRPGRRRMGGAHGRGRELAAARGAHLARRPGPVAPVRLRCGGGDRDPARRRPARACRRRGDRATGAVRLGQPGELAAAAADVRGDRYRRRCAAAPEVLRPRHVAASRRARPLDRDRH